MKKLKIQDKRSLWLIQKDISKDLNKLKIGKFMILLLKEIMENITIGRSYEMAPEIDGTVFI